MEKRNRKSPRLRGYDYRRPGWYFVTICTKYRECIFGQILGGRMILNQRGEIAHAQWYRMVEYRPYVVLDEFVVMPNHVHGIVGIVGDAEPRRGRDTARRVPTTSNPFRHVRVQNVRKFGPQIAGSISTIIGTYKSAVTKEIHRIEGHENLIVWQGRFHDHIIRDDEELNKIRNYIRHNPRNWSLDCFHP